MAEREAQHRTFELYKAAALSDERADHAIMNRYRQNVIGVQRISDILGQWENPAFDWGDRTAWRLFNAATHVLAGRWLKTPSLPASSTRSLTACASTSINKTRPDSGLHLCLR
jgi:hypothetical protein